MNRTGHLSYFLEIRTIAAVLLSMLLLSLHFWRSFIFRFGRHARYRYYVAIGLLVACAVIRILFFARATRIEFSDFAVWTIAYAVVLFIVLCEALLAGGAKRLTAWRGSVWVKELDYIYLTFGVIGLVWTINRLDLINHKVHIADFAGPYVVVTALVIRAIKTRAEIGKWNEPSHT